MDLTGTQRSASSSRWTRSTTDMDIPTSDIDEFSGSIVPSAAEQGLNGCKRGSEVKASSDIANITIRRTRRDTATPISRPIDMIFRGFNLNPVIEARPR